MTLSEIERDELIQHRIEKAYNLNDEVKSLIGLEFYNTAVNRIYYGIYHVLSALALKNNYSTSKHLQLIGWFNREFVKTKIIDMKLGKIVMTSFDMRSKGDYDDFTEYSKEEVEQLFKDMKLFIDTIKKLIETK